MSSLNSLVSGGSPPRDEKDYFQVTDELSQENAHFRISEALLAVMEQYKANRLEQEMEQPPQQPLSPTSSMPPPSSVFPVSSSLLPLSTSSSLISSSPPPRWQRNSPSFPSGWLSSWSSMSSVATTDGGEFIEYVDHTVRINQGVKKTEVGRFKKNLPGRGGGKEN